jgi:hypothetical protein
MKRLLAALHPGWLVVALGGLALWLVGCSTTDQENKSERPWNASQGWEGGVPSSLYDRQRNR